MNMINVKVGNNMSRTSVMVPDNKTLRQILEENNVQYDTATLYLDGCTLEPGSLDKTLADYNITETCYLVAVVKTQNA